MDDTNKKDISSQYFKTFMKFRKQTIVEIAEHTGISKRTIQGYAQGRPPFRKAPATNFMAITDYMEIEPHYMLGTEEYRLSEYLENIIRENRLRTLNDIRFLSDDVRLTDNTKTYREEQKEKRRLRKLKGLADQLIEDAACDDTVYDAAEPVPQQKTESDVAFEYYYKSAEERIRFYIEVLKKIENGNE